MARPKQQLQERRGEHRTEVHRVMNVTDANNGSVIGQLVNLSHDGLMLVSATPFEAGAVLQLWVPLPDSPEGDSSILVGVESLWCQDANDTGAFWTGFHIIDISPDDQARLNQVTGA